MNADEPTGTPQSPWWGDHLLDDQGRASFQLGSLSLWVRKHAREWWIAYLLEGLGEREAFDGPPPDTLPETPPETTHIERVAVESGGTRVRLRPTLADRPVISRPQTPLTLPPRAVIDLFVSTPLWVQIESLEPTQRLHNLPTRLMTQTWFGPSPREGELAYAARTQARIELREDHFNPYRALSKITVRNDSAESLLIERIKLPTRSLALFVDQAGTLWTPSILVEQSRDQRLSRVRLEEGSPQEAGTVEELAPARDPESKNYLVRAWGALIR